MKKIVTVLLILMAGLRTPLCAFHESTPEVIYPPPDLVKGPAPPPPPIRGTYSQLSPLTVVLPVVLIAGLAAIILSSHKPHH